MHAEKSEVLRIDHLLRRRVIVTLGKGGVGRTSVSAALALVAAGRGMRTLVIETDPARPIASTYGKKPLLEPLELTPRIWALFLGGQASLEDYLSQVVPRPILRALFASSLYRNFVHAAPGLRELTMMGKIYHEIERRPTSRLPWDLLVVDAPASSQAVAMLGMPGAVRETFGNGIVSREAAAVDAFFRDAAKCAMIVVTTAEALAMAETLELHHALQKIAVTTAAVIFNRTATAGFEAGQIARLLRRSDTNLEYVAELAEVARAELRRRNRERRAIGLAQRQIQAPVAVVMERRSLSGRKLAAAVAAQLTGH